MFTAKTENQLIDLLKIIAEEAVGFTKESLSEADDPYVNYYQDRLKTDKENLFEDEDPAEEEPQEAPSDEEEEEESDAEEAKTDEAEPEPSSQVAKDKPSDAEQQGSFGSSLDTLMKSINSVRAGQSLKNSSISDQLEIYYDRLAEDERNVLSLFVRELAKILSGVVGGVDAADPSDPPPEGLNVDIVTKGDEEQAPGTEESETPKPASKPARQDAQEEDEEPKTGEDTTPPIRVNEVQDLKEVRKKIRKLFLQ